MPYLKEPKWASRVLYGFRAALYLVAITMGVGAVWLTPMTIGARMPALVTDIWGAIAVLGSVGCLYGALARQYRWELGALPLMIGAVVVYSMTLWDITLDTPTRLAQASAVSALGICFLIRYVDLLVVRWRLAKQHQGMES